MPMASLRIPACRVTGHTAGWGAREAAALVVRRGGPGAVVRGEVQLPGRRPRAREPGRANDDESARDAHLWIR